MNGIKIYTIDSSKLKKIGTEGYEKCQEQAKIYQNQLLDSTGQTVQISLENKPLINQIFAIMNMDVDLDESGHYILIRIDFIEKDKYAICIYYVSKDSGHAAHRTVSYSNCAAESDYEAALKIVNCIRAAV